MNKIQRLILANQYRIRALLDERERRSFNHHAEALERGFALEYEADECGILEGIEDELSADGCREVMETLDLYRALQTNFDRLDDPTPIPAREVEFPGFDGNAGDGRLGYFRYLREEGRWADLRTWSDDLNSHGDFTAGYREMVERWRASSSRFELTKEDLLRILQTEERAQGAE